MLLLTFLDYWLILLNSCSYCTDFDSFAELVIHVEIPTREAKEKIKMHPATAEAISCTNLFMLLTHQFILVYFFNEIISCFICTFQTKFLACVFL